MTPPPSLQDLIETIQHDAGSDDELEQLATAARTITELNETSDAALGHFVDRARRAGRSWVEISRVLGVSKQAVHKRFGRSIRDVVADLIQRSATPGTTSPLQTLERFTDRARKVVVTAVEVATSAGHNYVGTEHLLLAHYDEPEAVAAKVLLAAGITREKVNDAIQAVTPDRPEPFEGKSAFTPRAADAMAAALSEALQLGHNYIGTEHILLALYRDPEGLAARILNQLGLDAETARAKVTEEISRFGRT